MRITLLVTFFLSAYVVAQEPVTATLVSNPFLETYQPEVSVSGNVIVGVMTAAAATAILKNQIAVRAHGAGSRAVCLRVASRDGIYTSRNIYSLPEQAEGPVLLPYESRLADVVRAYGSNEIAMAATEGECDSGSSDYFLLSAASETGSPEVVIYLNSFGATDVFFQLDSDPVPCEYFSEGRRTTYDFVCRLSAIGKHDSVPVTIIRERFGREQPSIELKIVGIGQ